MHDPQLTRLIDALDQATIRPASVPAEDLAEVQARLAQARALLGGIVGESAYLAFARHLTPTHAPTATVAASA